MHTVKIRGIGQHRAFLGIRRICTESFGLSRKFRDFRLLPELAGEG
jgi:hypothetical protein